MAVNAVTYYEVQCDFTSPEGVRCSTKTGDMGDFSAWADDGAAIDQWRDFGTYNYETGEAFCEEHAPKCPGCGIPLDDDEHEDDCPTLTKEN